MNRREFLQCAAILTTGAGLGQVGFALSEEQQLYLASAPNFNSQPVDFLTPARRRIVTALAEAIIPRTDTPGAIDAGVPAYLELMMASWLNEPELAIFDAGLADLETRIPADYGKPFEKLEARQQHEIITALEDAAGDSPWYEFGNVQGEFMSDAPFICQFKELTVWGFFTSEAGATQVLRNNPMPMRFDGHYPLSPDDSTWSGRII